MGGPVFLPRESHLLVIGPPRSGKTRSIVIPNIRFAPGPVVATSTKADLLEATYRERLEVGRAMVFDPSGTVATPKGVQRVFWSPIDHMGTYSQALGVTRAMIDAAMLVEGGRGSYSHWVERAAALVAPMIHAAQIGGYEMDTLMRWLSRRECKDPAGILKACDEELALDSMRAVLMSEERELSGIFSTALGLLGSYSYPELHQSGVASRIDPLDFVNSSDTLYLVSPSHIQRLVAPVIVGLIEEMKNRSYSLSANPDSDRDRKPLALILDEMANIAPLGGISSILSEGASQKVLLLGALQDLSQARARWGEVSQGFLTLFGSVLVLPGISDSSSLKQLSLISGISEAQSVSRNYGGSILGRILGPRGVTESTHPRPVLEPWEIARSKGNQGYLYRRSRDVRRVRLIPFEEISLSTVNVRSRF